MVKNRKSKNFPFFFKRIFSGRTINIGKFLRMQSYVAPTLIVGETIDTNLSINGDTLKVNPFIIGGFLPFSWNWGSEELVSNDFAFIIDTKDNGGNFRAINN
ncbi:33246_t:CDS:1 [Gigaspora margarita]|uniref:33246_t:CDS:1 n=1 Tax=Gigaspora margarita TaxID=4874 RepID=A0ABM8W5L3_GIGMA|nr:33246_t:CDS:1 [Gigaspora margarita]